MTRNFEKELVGLMQRYCTENKSDTPAYILGRYLSDCLYSFERNVRERDELYDFDSCIRPTTGLGG